MSTFYFTQTSIKDLENPTTCPYRWKAQWLDGQISFPSNEDQEKGKYFEQLAIGGGAIEGEVVADLPRLKSGEKSAEQKRIESQASRCKRMLTDPEDAEWLGFEIESTQVEIKSKSGRKGTFDIVAKDKDGRYWIIDLKLTRDLTNDRTKYGWGNAWEDMDLIQMVHYESLFEEAYGVRPKMSLLVMDYSPAKRVEFGEIVVSDKKRLDKEIRFKACEEVRGLYDKHGWIKIPSIKECEGCTLKCELREMGSKLVKKTINY